MKKQFVLSAFLLLIHFVSSGQSVDTLMNFSKANLASIVGYSIDNTFPFDSGFVYGTNVFEDKGFVERYDYNSPDTFKVIGAVVNFTGKYNTNSNRTISLNAWDEKPTYLWSSHFYSEGEPQNILTSRIISIRELGIDNSAANDTQKVFLFPIPTSFLAENFFIGYEINYSFSGLNGDTIGLKSTPQGSRPTSDFYYLVGPDTFFRERTMVESLNNIWYDNYITGGTYRPSYLNNLAIFPIVVFKNPVNVKGVQRNGLIFSGIYPNPCRDQATIKLALRKNASLSIDITDAVGNIVRHVTQSNLAAGEHSILLNARDLATNTYFVIIKTNQGDGISSEITITK